MVSTNEKHVHKMILEQPVVPESTDLIKTIFKKVLKPTYQ